MPAVIKITTNHDGSKTRRNMVITEQSWKNILNGKLKEDNVKWEIRKGFSGEKGVELKPGKTTSEKPVSTKKATSTKTDEPVDRKLLFAQAKQIAEEKGVKAPHHFSGADTLQEFIEKHK